VDDSGRHGCRPSTRGSSGQPGLALAVAVSGLPDQRVVDARGADTRSSMPHEERSVNISQAAKASGISRKISATTSDRPLPRACRARLVIEFPGHDVHILTFAAARDAGSLCAIKAAVAVQDPLRPAAKCAALAQDNCGARAR